MRRAVFLVLCMLLASNVLADSPAKRQSIDELMKVMKVDSMLNAVYSQFDQMFLNIAQELNLKASERPIFEKYAKKLAEVMKEEVTWEKMKEPMIAIYQKYYTEKEISDLLAFYKSDTGRKLIEKMPLVMQESMVESQAMMKSFMPKVMNLSQELKNEIQLARKEN